MFVFVEGLRQNFDNTQTKPRTNLVDENAKLSKTHLWAAKRPPECILLSLSSHQPNVVEVVTKCCHYFVKVSHTSSLSSMDWLKVPACWGSGATLPKRKKSWSVQKYGDVCFWCTMPCIPRVAFCQRHDRLIRQCRPCVISLEHRRLQGVWNDDNSSSCGCGIPHKDVGEDFLPWSIFCLHRWWQPQPLSMIKGRLPNVRCR